MDKNTTWQHELDNIKNKLDTIDEQGIGLTEWELEFLDQMLKLTDKNRMPSGKQVNIINRIHQQRAYG